LFLKTDGAGNLSFDSLSFSTPLAVIGNATAGSEIRLPEDTDNGSNYVAIKAPDTIASNLTLTLPSADGSSGQVLQTNGSGVLSFTSVSTDIKAWVNFDGTGTPSIRASKNVSSITDNGTGLYTVNFTNALTDANYVAVFTCKPPTDAVGTAYITHNGSYTASAVSVRTVSNTTGNDQPIINVAIFR
jgi:hypothetical protein